MEWLFLIDLKIKMRDWFKGVAMNRYDVEVAVYDILTTAQQRMHLTAFGVFWLGFFVGIGCSYIASLPFFGGR